MAMIKKLLFTLSLCMLFGGTLFAQSTIKGEVKDPRGNGIPYLQILLKQDGRIVNGAHTDDLGAYQIFGVPAGTYDLSVGGTFNCSTTHTEKGIYVPASEVKFVNIVIDCSSTELQEVEVQYVPPVFSQDNTTSASKLTGDEVRKTPGRSISAALASFGGVAGVDGNVAAVRGNRSDGQQTIIDGVRVRGNSGVTMQSIEGFELIQGGIPAEYGDGTSFTVITTRGVARDYHGNIELRSSVEGYGQTLAAASISGPILKGKTPQDPARMGFLISAEGNYNVDSRPLRGGSWVAKQDVIDDIISNPVDYIFDNSVERWIPYYRANHLGSENFEKTRVRKDARDWGFIAQGKIDVMGGGKDARGRAKNNLRFTLGGSFQYINALNWGTQRALFNSANNAMTTNSTLRVYARLNHRVKTDTAANAILKNIMYDVNVNYTLFNSKTMDRNHKDNLFAYGYIGKFTSERQDLYDDYILMGIEDWAGDSIVEMWVPRISAYQAVTWVSFDKDGFTNNGNYYNPGMVPFTQNFVDLIFKHTQIDINNATEEEKQTVQRFLRQTMDGLAYSAHYGLLNGDLPGEWLANGLYSHPGTLSSGYGKERRESIGAKASLSLNIKNHEVKFGFELEKLTYRSYDISAHELWRIMRQQTYGSNTYFPFDYSNPYWKSGDPTPRWGFDEMGNPFLMDTLMYHVIPTLTNFDLNLRKHKNITDMYQVLDIDSYDPNDFSLGLFSNYELLNSGNSLVSYSGYDYTGKISNKKINLKDFFSEENLHSADKYAIGAFEPIYLALFLQDKFSISNLLFNVGLRLDYFNANQSVLSDPFLLSPAYTVGELGAAGWIIPIDNAEDNWIPYVKTAHGSLDDGPRGIVAYRSGKTWFDENGQEVPDPTSYLGQGGPVMKDPKPEGSVSRVHHDAFTKYKPNWSLMPRISFSFPVSTNSLFYAHYNIITYRPSNLQINPIAYLFISSYQTPRRQITNPNLRAQRTIDYEIGFRQAVGENAALSITAFYSEKRDQIQSYRYTGAYPNTYYSFENQDFGTVQGYMLEMNMRSTKNLNFRVSYTLSFAKGTGSSSGSNLAIIASGQPNLRTLTNLSYDQRHNISGNIDLRFGYGANYNGPKSVKLKKGTETAKEIRWLENAGATLLVSAASGMPYSRSGVMYSPLGWSDRSSGTIKGTINGANMPWIFQCDLRLDKTFIMNLASKKNTNESGQRNKKPGMLTIYLDFQNLLNLKNVINVYDYTGSPDDDGFLSSSLFQNITNSGMAFGMSPAVAANYYEMLIRNPWNYTQPFRVHLGISFSF